VTSQRGIDLGVLDYDDVVVFAPKSHVAELISGSVHQSQMSAILQLFRLDTQTRAFVFVDHGPLSRRKTQSATL